MKPKLALLATLGAMLAVPTVAYALIPGLTLGGTKLDRSNGTAKLATRVNQPGHLRLRGHGVKTVDRTPAAAGKYKLPIKPVGSARTQLEVSGDVTVKVTMTFTVPPSGSYQPTVATKSKRITLIKK